MAMILHARSKKANDATSFPISGNLLVETTHTKMDFIIGDFFCSSGA